MGCIVCATRGGAGSRVVQERAIELARAGKSKLIFLYVIDMSNVTDADEMLMAALRTELNWLGRTLLNVAHQRAENQQIDSEIVIREGEVREEICLFLQERSAELLLIGAPRGTSALTFGDDVIELFAQEIIDESGVKVEIVRPTEPAEKI